MKVAVCTSILVRAVVRDDITLAAKLLAWADLNAVAKPALCEFFGCCTLGGI